MNKIETLMAAVDDYCDAAADAGIGTNKIGFAEGLIAKAKKDHLRKLLEEALRQQAGMVLVAEGESLWLIETSAVAQPNGPQRHFWDGRSWNWNALKAVRYPMRESALEVVGDPEGGRYYLGSVHRNDILVCEHLFQCGITSPPPAPQTSEATGCPNCGDSAEHEWVLITPENKRFTGKTKMECYRNEISDRIPPTEQLANIMRANEDAEAEYQAEIAQAKRDGVAEYLATPPQGWKLSDGTIELLRQKYDFQSVPQFFEFAYDVIAADRQQREGMVLVPKEEANNYCQILSALGMEEEGDPVKAVNELIAAAQVKEPT